MMLKYATVIGFVRTLTHEIISFVLWSVTKQQHLIIITHMKRGYNQERKKLPELETIKKRFPWYAVSQLKEAPILFQYLIDNKAKAFWNKARAHAPNIIHYVIPFFSNHVLALLSYFNSSVCALFVELYGRSYGGGVLKIESV